MNDDTKINEDYRRLVATANKLETIQSNLESVIDFFLAPIVKLYHKLSNDCMKLLFECEFKLDHFRKAEELVWRRIYHDIYRFQKTNRHCLKKQDEYLMESHFISGIGFYSSLIVKLRYHYKITHVPGVITPLNLTLGPLDNFVDNQKLNEFCANEENSWCSALDNDIEKSAAKGWAQQAIYRSLIYMGDLARYLIETSQFDTRKLAFEFYRSAYRNQPECGLPFNQLATLAGGSNHNLDAVCNYMRCCLRPKPFEGAEGNMKKIFDLNKKFYDEVIKNQQACRISEVLASEDPGAAAEAMMRSIIVTFIKLTSDLWSVVSCYHVIELIREDITNVTRAFFESLREALELEPIVPLVSDFVNEHEFSPISGGLVPIDKPRYINPTIMYQFCSIALMLISKCHTRQACTNTMTDAVDQHVIDLVNILALNLLHYSTSKCHKMIMSRIQGLRMDQQTNIERICPGKNVSNVSVKCAGGNLSNSTIHSITDQSNRRALSRIRQRKAATNYSDSGGRLKSAALHAEDSDMSELEETALSTIDALEISSGMSEETDPQISDLIDLESSDDEDLYQNHAIDQQSLLNSSLSKPAVRQTRSHVYDRVRSVADIPSSLPVPDLVFGDANESTSHSPGSDVLTGPFVDRSSLPRIPSELESTLTHIYNQTYLPTVKVFCDWLLSSPELISSNLQSFHAFCAGLEELTSSLMGLIKLADTKDDGARTSPTAHLQHVFDGANWIQKYPMSCDYPLMNFSSLKSVHELNIDFNYQGELKDHEAGFITVQCVIAFSHALTAFLDNKARS